MNELLVKVLQYVLGVWRFRWVAMVLAWVLALAGWFLVENLQDKYIATARIQVDSNRILKPLLQGIAIQPDVNERVSLMSKSVLTRPNLLKLMKMSGLDKDRETKKELTGVDLENELIALRETLELSGTRGNSSLYNVSYKNPDRQLAKRVVESVITVFVETNLGDERQDSSFAQAFLDKQINEYENRLKEAEDRRSAFRRRNAGRMPSEAGGYFQRLDMSLEKKRKAELELKKALNRRNELKRQIAGESPGTPQYDALWQDPINEKISTYQNELNSLLVRYTERHPRIHQLRSAIAELETQREQFSGRTRPKGGETLVANPVYQEMRALLSVTEAGIAELQVEVNENRQQVEDLRGTIDSIPKIEAELQQLDRDYATVKEQHVTLLRRRESARMSEKVEQNVDDIKFKVIDPPFVPAKPDEPNKLILNALVLIMSTGAAVGLSLLLSLLRPVFFSQQNLRQSTGYPVLGSVMLITKAHRRMRILIDRVAFSSLAVSLLAVFCVLSYMRLTGTHTDALQKLDEIEVIENQKQPEFKNNTKKSSLLQNVDKVTAESI